MSTNILTHHKCASAWLEGYINEYCGINRFDVFRTRYSDIPPEVPQKIRIVLNASYRTAKNWPEGGIHVIRNPLDIVVSAYYSHRNTHSLNGWPQLSAQRDILRSFDEHDGMMLTLSFLERDDFYQDTVAGPLHALRHWNYDDDRFSVIRMEDAVQDPARVVGSLLLARHSGSHLPDPDRHSFQAVTGRRVGEVNDASHYRSGQPGQWRTALPAAVVAYMRAHYEPFLRRFYPDVLE